MTTSYWTDGDIYWNDLVAVWQPGRMFTDLSDGIKIGDALQEYWIISLTDGTKIGDTGICIARMRPVLTDGVTLSDSPDGKQQLFPDLTDGVKISDSLNVKTTFYCELADGVKLSDALQEYWIATLTDGIKVSDFTLRKAEKSELRIDFEIEPIKLYFDCNIEFNDDFTFKSIDKTLEAIKQELESFSIKPITMTFRGLPIEFDFKANPKDYDIEE